MIAKFRCGLPVCIAALLFITVCAASAAGPTNAILFVTQVQIPGDFAAIASLFGNHRGEISSCGRGGDLWIRHPDGSLRNLTRAAGFGRDGAQHTNGIAVRQPCVHWSGRKAVFSMVVGAPRAQFDYASGPYYWQLYEITNFLDAAATPVITRVSNQPTNYNNISPLYGTDDRIIFTSDRPRGGWRHLHPQLDEYEEAPTVSGLWSLDPASGNLFMMEHSPSGSFTPSLDSAGRVVFVRWDHMQQDQQADYDRAVATPVYGTFDWSSEAEDSVVTTNRSDVFPEPRHPTGPLTGHTFNHFFPWQINEDGTEEETLNHVGRHELGGSYMRGGRSDDPNIQDIYYFGNRPNTNNISNFLHIREDPALPGRFLGVDAPEFISFSAGQLIALTGGTNVNPDAMQITYLTPRVTSLPADDPTNPPPGHTGLYRNPLATTDGHLIASHTSWTGRSRNTGTTTQPATKHDFRLKFLVASNGFHVPGAPLTPGLTNNARFWDPDALVIYTNVPLWEFDPVEVVARQRPPRRVSHVAAPERAMFKAAGVDMAVFQNWLAAHNLALIVSRDITTRDRADILQPVNLRVTGSGHSSIGKPGKTYDVAWMQIFQGDLLRGLHFNQPANPRPGRRVLARELNDPVADNPPVAPTAPAGSVRLGPDGSLAALVPARRAMSWQLVDTNGAGVVRERYWVTFQPGEIRTCTSCHGINTRDQANHLAPTNNPAALLDLLHHWKSRYVPASLVTNIGGTNYPVVTFQRRLAATNLTYIVEHSTNLIDWLAGSRYTPTNTVPNTPLTTELSRNGSPNEAITVRGNAPFSVAPVQFLRVTTSAP